MTVSVEDEGQKQHNVCVESTVYSITCTVLRVKLGYGKALGAGTERPKAKARGTMYV